MLVGFGRAGLRCHHCCIFADALWLIGIYCMAPAEQARPPSTAGIGPIASETRPLAPERQVWLWRGGAERTEQARRIAAREYRDDFRRRQPRDDYEDLEEGFS